jgi:outer membrane protein TolC
MKMLMNTTGITIRRPYANHESERKNHARRYRITGLLLAALLGAQASLHAQDTISLPECYLLLDQNYPLAKQKTLITQNYELTKKAIQKNFLPQVSLSAQATYQSDVPHVPLAAPGNDIPIPNKDQYRATIDVNQLLYDGGAVRNSIRVEELDNQASREQITVSLHQLKVNVNQWYFSILLLQEKNKLLTLTEENLSARLNEVRSAIRNGTVVPSSEDVIYAEMLQIRQQQYENEADKEAALGILSDLIGIPLDNDATLRQPELEVNFSAPLSRPELSLFQLQQQQVEASSELMGKSNAPRLGLFAQGGYGNPGLNLLDNTFQPFFMGGIRLSWKILDWNLIRHQQQALLISKQIIDNQREVFDLNTNIELARYQTEIQKLTRLIDTDAEIIALRRKVALAAHARLRNGTMTASEYLLESNALNQSLITKKTHEITLLQARANYMLTQGNITGEP